MTFNVSIIHHVRQVFVQITNSSLHCATENSHRSPIYKCRNFTSQ